MWKNDLIYRDNLDISNDLTFGIEIEFDKARRSVIEDSLDKAYMNKYISSKWQVKTDETIYEDAIVYSSKGGEAVSNILTDNNNSWNDIKYVCKMIKDFDGIATDRCGAHVHIGASVLNNELLYYERLMKMWTVYEGIILRFCYGEDDKARKFMNLFAASPYFLIKKLFRDNYDFRKKKLLLNYDKFLKIIKNYLGFKNLSLSFKGLDNDFLKIKYGECDNLDKYRTIEIRAGNGSLNCYIWQNYVNLYAKMILCCLDDNRDWGMICKKFEECLENDLIDVYNIDKADEFCDFVFDEEIDKYNFMLQYMKNGNINNDMRMIKRKIR